MTRKKGKYIDIPVKFTTIPERDTKDWEVYRKSVQAMEELSDAIANAINKYNEGFTYELIKAFNELEREYGLERLVIITANTLKRNSYDPRYSRCNKEWAQSVFIDEQFLHCTFPDRVHQCVLNGFADIVRRKQQGKQ